MKMLLMGVSVVLALAVSTAAFGQCGADRPWDDLSWWGKSGATPEVYKDEARGGCWWWPKAPKGGEAATGCSSGGPGNEGDQALWGNRGVVFSQCPVIEKKVKDDDVTPPPPPDPPMVLREATVLSDVLFDFDKAVLKAESIPAIDAVIADLKKFGDDTVEIQGHTCDLGSEEYNKGLGQRRADAVKKYMLEHGIDAGRMTAVSMGESDPAKPNDSPANRRLNRRVVFKVDIKTKVEQK